MKHIYKEILLFKWLLLIIDTQEITLGIGLNISNGSTNIFSINIICLHIGILIPKRPKVFTNMNKAANYLAENNHEILEKYGSGIDEQGSGIDWITKEHDELINKSKETNKGHNMSREVKEQYLGNGLKHSTDDGSLGSDHNMSVR